MRRSAAPSFLASAKRFRFQSSTADNTSDLNDVNDLLNYMEPEIARNFSSPAINSSSSFENKSNEHTLLPEDASETCLRSTSDILQLISDTSAVEAKDLETNVQFSLSLDNNSESKIQSIHNVNFVKSSLPHEEKRESKKKVEKISEPNYNSSSSASTISRYNVLWCKRSSKKHKKWEGDGILIIKDRSAILKDSEGKEIDRGIGYKLKDVSSLEEGSKFCIGGKEREIQDLISTETIVNNEVSQIQKPLQTLENSSLIQRKPKHKQLCM